MSVTEKFDLTRFLKDNYPIIGFFLVMLALHAVMGFLGDDIEYAKMLSRHSLIDFLLLRYNEWSSRVIIEGVLVILARQSIILWKILDTILYTLGVYLLIRFINKDNNPTVNLLGVLLFLMYPFFDMAGAGWISTTLNYSWCVVFGIISLIPLNNEISGKKTSPLIYIISILSLIYAVNQEQACAIIFGINVLYLIHCIIKKRGISRFNVLVIAISAVSLIMILTCPGNAERLIIETSRYYAGYPSLGIMEKLYLGTIPTVGILLQDKILFTVFYIILSVCALLKTKNRYLKYVLYFNIVLIVFLVSFKTLLDIPSIPEYLNIGFMHTPAATSLFSAIDSIGKSVPIISDAMGLFTYKGIPDALTAPAILTILISIYLIASSCWMIFKTFTKDHLFPLLLFILGFLSRLVVGFSPTVFESGPRTALFFYIIMIAITIMLIKKLYDENAINEVWEKRIKVIFAVLGLFTYMAVFAIVFVMF
jgi:hypothetical protein